VVLVGGSGIALFGSWYRREGEIRQREAAK
jgi:hypothetical protein